MKIERKLLIFYIIFTFIISSIPLSLQGYYGEIAASVTDTLEWDTQEGRMYGQDAVVRVNKSEYYLIANAGDTGTDYDGFLVTIQAYDKNASIKNTVVSRLEFDTSDGYSATVVHIPGTDKYAVAYEDNTGGKVTVVTVQVWANNGTINQTVIDTQQLSYLSVQNAGYSGHVNFIGVYDNVYAVTYPDSTTWDGFMETIWINDTGTINDTILDTEEFATVYCASPNVCLVDTNTTAITYINSSSTGDYMLMTYNISTSGAITDTYADSWAYEASPYRYEGTTCRIKKIGTDVYSLVYVDSAYDIQTKTVTISDAGDITAAFIDTLTVYTGVLSGLSMLYPFFIDDPRVIKTGDGVMGLTFTNDSTNFRGYIRTWNITSAGAMDAAIADSFLFSSTDAYYAPATYMNTSSYLIVYQGGGSDGFAITINITTNYSAVPTLTNPDPTNGETEVPLTPTCNITTHSLYSGIVTVKFYWYDTGTSTWILEQVNSSVAANGTYRWEYKNATQNYTVYYWKVYVNDTLYSNYSIYSFTTPKIHTFYVSNTGLDTNSGEITAPWQTIGKVNTVLNTGFLEEGDDIYFNRGDIFTDTYLNVKIGGNGTNDMVIGAYGTGADPIIEGAGVRWNVVTLTDDVDDVTFENLTLKNSSADAMYVLENHTNITIENVTIYEPALSAIFFNQTDGVFINHLNVSETGFGGVVFYGDIYNRMGNVIFKNSKVINTGAFHASDGVTIHEDDFFYDTGDNFYLYNVTSSGFGEQGFDFIGGFENVLVVDCEAYNNDDSSIAMGYGVKNVTFINFYSHDERTSTNTMGFLTDNADHVLIRNSRFLNIKYHYFYVGDTGTITNVTVLNNDIVYDGYSKDNDIMQVSGTPDDVIFKNNIITSQNYSTPTYFMRYLLGNTLASTNSYWINNCWFRTDNGSTNDNWWRFIDGATTTYNTLAEWEAQANVEGDFRSNPRINGSLTGNWDINISSLCINNGAFPTYTNGGGTGYWVTVDDSRYFQDGYGLTTGDCIEIGTDVSLHVDDMNYYNESIKVNRSITWVDGDSVSFGYDGLYPDIGCNESGYSNITLYPGQSVITSNEYYGVTTPVVFDNITLRAAWISVNGIGFNVSHGGAYIYNNFSSIQSYPRNASFSGYVVNWTQQKDAIITSYTISGLKASYDYILYSNGTGTTHATDATGSFTFWSAITSTNRVYALEDPGIPNVWFVATTGSDATGTGSIANPFATLQKAINASSTSDTIYMRAGTYTPYTSVIVNRSGTAVDWFVISNYNNEAVIINGTNSLYLDPSERACIEFRGSDYIRFTGITVNWSRQGGISLDNTYGASNYLRVDNCTISNCSGFAFKVTSGNSYIWFENNTVYNNHNNHSGLTISQEAVSISGSSYVYIKDNHILNNHAENIDLKSGCGWCYIHHNTVNTTGGYTNKGGRDYWGGVGIYLDARGIDHNISIYNNLVYGNISGIMLNTETTGRYENVNIYNNIVNITNTTGGDHTDLGRYCLVLDNYGVSAGIFKDINIYCNTFNTGVSAYHVPIWIKSGLTEARTARVNISNNILTMYNSTAASYAYYMMKISGIASTSSDISMYGNLYFNKMAGATHRIQWSDGDWTSATPAKWGNSPLFVTPQFINPNPVYNFHLNATSPCIGTATSSLVPATDFDDVSRPQGTGYDLGAYERVGGGGTAYAPVQTNPAPANGSSSIILPLLWLNITVTDQNADPMNVYFRSNHSGAWTTLGSNLTVTNGTYRKILPGFTGSAKKWWSVNVTDGSVWTNRTYWFTPWYPTEGITINSVKANWTTSNSVNISWVKGANTTTTYVYRSNIDYMDGAAILYIGSNSYYNDTLVTPTIPYYYTLRAYNSVSTLFGNRLNVSLAETFNTSYLYTGASWVEFQGWMATDHSIQTRFQYADDDDFTVLSTNTTQLQTSYTTTVSPATDTVQGSNWRGQRFTTGADNFYIYNVTFKAYRSGNPGALYCILYAVGADLLPTGLGTELSIGSMNANTMTAVTGGAWYNITMPAYECVAATSYAIVFYTTSTTFANRVNFIIDSMGTYTGGQEFYSNDYGATYTNRTAIDKLFKIYGNEPAGTGYHNTTNTTRSTTGIFDIMQGSLDSGHLYYYRVAANDTKGNMTRGNIRYTLTNPGPPTYLNMIPTFTNNSIYISWTPGVGANRTVIVDGGESYPTDAADGAILYNGTGTSTWATNISFNASHSIGLFGFTTWSTLSRWSSPATVPWGGCTFIVRNESAPWQIVNATIMVTDALGLHPAYFTNVYGYYSFNISQIPYGENTRFYISNSSYHSRLYVFDLEPDVFYNLTFYLPPLYPPGWNTTSGNTTGSYLVQIVTEQVLPIQGAVVGFYRYMNYTGKYTYIGGFITDGNGQGAIDLFPYQLYMVKITCDGYENATEFWTPTILEQSLTKVFKIYHTVDEPPTAAIYNEHITFNGYINRTSHKMYINYTDDMSMTLNAQVYVFEFNATTNTTSLIGVNVTFFNSNFQVIHSDIDNRNTYTIVLCHNHTLFNFNRQSFVLGPRLITITTPGYTETLWTGNYGYNPFGWTNSIMGVFVVLALFYGAREDLPLIYLALGVTFLFANLSLGIFTWNVHAADFIPLMCIIAGILTAWHRYR